MTRKLGERWVRYAGSQSMSRWIPWIAGFIAVLNAGLAVFSFWTGFTLGDLSREAILRDGWPGSAMMGIMNVFLALMFLILTLLNFERRQFYLIIKKQEQRIAELEARLSNRTEQP